MTDYGPTHILNTAAVQRLNLPAEHAADRIMLLENHHVPARNETCRTAMPCMATNCAIEFKR